MAGPGGAVQALADALPARIVATGPSGYMVVDVGRPEDRAARRVQHRRVGRLAARIGGEILVRAELGRIDEDRGDDMVRAPPRLGDQRHMAGVERAHRRHEGDRAAAAREARRRLALSASASRMICTASWAPIED